MNASQLPRARIIAIRVLNENIELHPSRDSQRKPRLMDSNKKTPSELPALAKPDSMEGWHAFSSSNRKISRWTTSTSKIGGIHRKVLAVVDENWLQFFPVTVCLFYFAFGVILSMNRFILGIIAVCGLAVSVRAQAPATVAEPPKTPVKTAPQSAFVAAPKMGNDGKPQEGFMASHESFVRKAKEGKAELVFLGDSITAGWGRQAAIWDKAFGQYQPANFGIGGDRTQHVLWRITNGELDGIKPKAVVIMIGTNNSAQDPAEDIAKGVTAIVETVRAKQPQAKILLLAVFPRGAVASPNPQRDKLIQVNGVISKLDDAKHVHFLDIGSKFLQPDGSISKEIMPDSLHLSPAGYQIWADAITPKLAELMK